MCSPQKGSIKHIAKSINKGGGQNLTWIDLGVTLGKVLCDEQAFTRQLYQ